jgi:hypothetical protein
MLLNKTSGGDQGYIALTVAVDRWQIVGDARQYFVPVKVQAVGNPLKVSGRCRLGLMM